MLLRKMFGFIEDVRLGIDLQARIRQAQTRRDFADTDNGYTCVFNCPEWLFSELASERNSILVKDVAQSLRYTKGTPQKDDISARLMRLSNGCSHFLDPAVKLFARLPSNEERRPGGTKFFQIDSPVLGCTNTKIFGRDENFLWWERHSAGIRCLLKALLEGSEELLIGLLQNLRLVEIGRAHV